MINTYKVRVGFSKELHDFDTRDKAFDWIKRTRRRCIFSLLTYEDGELVNMDRWYYKEFSFKKEDIHF